MLHRLLCYVRSKGVTARREHRFWRALDGRPIPFESQAETACDERRTSWDSRSRLAGYSSQRQDVHPGPAARDRAASALSSPPWRVSWPSCGSGSVAVHATPRNHPPVTDLATAARKPFGLQVRAASKCVTRAIAAPASLGLRWVGGCRTRTTQMPPPQAAPHPHSWRSADRSSTPARHRCVRRGQG